MTNPNLKELHYIVTIENVPSILRVGILSHKRAERIPHKSIAMQEVQNLRKGKTVPGGRLLHDYVNLYINARNPMMYKRKDQHKTLCVLVINLSVLELPDVVITDGNAASPGYQYTRFYTSPDGLKHIDWEVINARYWTDENPIAQFYKRRVKCAEVLVPDVVEPSYIIGAYVSCADAESALKETGFQLPIKKDTYLFFR